MFGLGWQELTIILVIALIIFGPSKLPELGKSLGQAISGFKEGTSRVRNAAEQEVADIKKTINDGNSEK